jgi:TonB family protein
MIFFPRLSTAILLGLTLSSSSHSASLSSSNQQLATAQTGTTQQTEQTSLESDKAKASAPDTPDQNGTYRIGGNVVAPTVIHSVKPQIAKKDRKVAKSGTTVIQITVAKDGSVQNAHVLKSSAETMKPGNDQAAAALDQTALDAVNQYRFQPATLNGQPIPVLLNVEIKFRIF